jgi:hypothetical protein
MSLPRESANDRAFGTAEAAYEKSMEADLYG